MTVREGVITIVGMLLATTVVVCCIVNDIDHGIIYGGLAAISGLAGYTLGRKANP